MFLRCVWGECLGFVGCYLLFVVSSLRRFVVLLFVGCALFVVRCLRIVDCCLMVVVCYLLFVVCCFAR